MAERSYLSIGDVLALLREEFPDITISKIRFLESRGLLDPERTPSGYRKFYDTDVDRLRWILRQQREHFLPLKVIKGRLEGGSAEEALPLAPSLFDPPAGSADPRPDDPPPGVGEPALVGAVASSAAASGAAAAGSAAASDAGVANGSSGFAPTGEETPLVADSTGRTGGTGADQAGGADETAPPVVQSAVPAVASTARSDQEPLPRGEESSRVAQRSRATGLPQCESPAPSPSPGNSPTSGRRSATSPSSSDTAGPRSSSTVETSFGLPPVMTPASAAERERMSGAARTGGPVPSTAPPAGPRTEAAGATVPRPPTTAMKRGEGTPPGSLPTAGSGLGSAVADTGAGEARPAAPASGRGTPERTLPRPTASGPASAAEEATSTGVPSVGDAGRRASRASLGTGASLTLDELADACGLSTDQVEQVEEYGLIAGRMVAGVKCFDEEALVITRLAAGFAKYGVEPRHLRTYKHAADREAGLFAQVVTPLLRQRNPLARTRAGESLTELTELGAGLQAALVRSALRDLTGG